MKTENSPTWISEQVARERLRIGRRRFFDWLKMEKVKDRDIVIRIVGKAAHGSRREIRLDSLPTKYQSRYLASAQAEEESDRVDHSRDADTSLSTGGPSAPSTLVDRSEEELAKAIELADDLKKVKRANNIGEAKRSLAAKLGVTERTVENWLAVHRREGFNGLLRKQRKDKGEPRALPQSFVAIAADLFLKDRSPIPTFKAAQESLQRECIKRGIEPPADGWARRWIKRELPKMTADFKRSTKKYREDWRVKYEPCVLREHHDRIRDICDGDWHHLNIEIVDDEGLNGGTPYRPDICVVADCCTGETLGFHIQKNGNALGIGLALRMAILPKTLPGTQEIDPLVPRACAGKFSEFYTDQGQDFTGNYIKAVMRDLGGSTRECEGYHGQSKPIERWFKTANEKLISRLPGYVGRNKDERPWNAKPTLTRRELFAKIYEWTFHEFHNTATRALRGLSPYQALTQHVDQGFRPIIPDERQLDLLLMPGRNVKVRKWGIQLFGTKDRRNLYQGDLFAEHQLIGERVEARYNPDDLGTLIIYHNQRFIGEVHQDRYRGYREKDLRELYHRRKVARQAVQNKIKDLAAQAQYPDPLEQVKAERIYSEELSKERQQIAANASPQHTPALLPQFARAKKYQLKRHLRPLPKTVTPQAAPVEKNRWLDEEPCVPVERKREKSPWLDSEDAPEVCHACDKGGIRLRYCLDCGGESYCPKCHASSKHRFCDDCLKAHTHIETPSEPPRSRPADDGLKSSEELFGNSEAAPQPDELLDSEELFKTDDD